MTRKVLGVKVDDILMGEAVELIAGWLVTKKGSSLKRIILKKDHPFIVVTPGPEFLVTAQEDVEFKNILNAADLSVPDGFGLHLAGIKNRVPGVDLMISLCQLAAKNGWTIGMMGHPNTSLAAEKLRQRFPGIKILYSLDNPETDNILRYYDIINRDTDTVKKRTNELPPVDLLFVGVGHPKQEELLFNCKLKNENCKFRVGMGVGGSFDFISGRVWEPGGIFNTLGLKWLGRLMANPGHFSRVVKATIIFPLMLLKEKISLIQI